MNDERWSVGKEDAGSRIDKWLPEKHVDWSRTIIQSWIKSDRVYVNGKKVKSNYVIQEKDEIIVYPEDKTEPEILPEPLNLDIYYEDEDILIVNKPRGMVVHPAPGHYSGTLVNGLLYHCKTLSSINGEWRPGIVHRLDKDTSGLLVVAKRDAAHEELSRQLKERRIKRVYRAIVHGDIPHEYGTIEAPIGRDPKDRQKMSVTDKNAKDATTYFSVVKRWGTYTFVECRLETGRMHQIRVHMAYIGHPVAGDPKYGRTKTLPIDGQALHAYKLEFIHPLKGHAVQFEADLPKDIAHLMKELEKKD